MSTEHEVLESSIWHAVRDGIARAIAVIGLAGVALIHPLDAPGKFQETIEGSLVALSAMVVRDRARAERERLGARRAPLRGSVRV
jgi:ribosomal protein S9